MAAREARRVSSAARLKAATSAAVGRPTWRFTTCGLKLTCLSLGSMSATAIETDGGVAASVDSLTADGADVCGVSETVGVACVWSYKTFLATRPPVF